MNYLSWTGVVLAIIGLSLADTETDNRSEGEKESADTKSLEKAAGGTTNTRLFTNNQAVNGAVVGFGAGVIGSLLVGKLLEGNNRCSPYRGKRDNAQTRFLGGSKRCPQPNNGYHSNGYQQPVNSYPQSGYPRPSGNQYQNNGYNLPGNGYHQPTNVYHKPTNGYNQPINNYHQSNNGYRQPSNGYHPANNGYHPANNGYHPTNNGYHQSNNGYRQSNNGYNQPTNVYSPTPSGYQPLGPGYPGYNNNNNYQPGFVNQPHQGQIFQGRSLNKKTSSAVNLEGPKEFKKGIVSV